MEQIKLQRLLDLSKQSDKDAKQVYRLTKKYGFGEPAWQKAMLKRIGKKLVKGEELTEIDQAFLELQAKHREYMQDYMRSMGADAIYLN
jgi:hypothetical protein